MLNAEQLLSQTEKKQPSEIFYKNFALKFCNIHGKTPVRNYYEQLFWRTFAYGCLWTDFMKWFIVWNFVSGSHLKPPWLSNITKIPVSFKQML